MAVITRAKANQFQEEEFATLRKIDISHDTDQNYDDSFVMTTRSATGHGIHKRWVYPEPTKETIPDAPSDPEPEDQSSSESSWSANSQVLQDEQYRTPTPHWIAPEDAGYSTPKSSPPATPSAPKLLSRTFTTGVLADTDMKFVLHIKKDEDVGKALWRHVELYVKESQIRKRENQRRVYEFVKTRPHLLHEAGEDTELFVRADSKWDSDPFL